MQCLNTTPIVESVCYNLLLFAYTLCESTQEHFTAVFHTKIHTLLCILVFCAILANSGVSATAVNLVVG